MRAAIVAVLLIGCGSGGYSSSTDGTMDPMPTDSVSPGGSPTVPMGTGGMSPTGNGGNVMTVTAAGGMNAAGGSPMVNNTGGVTTNATGGSPSGNGGMPSGTGGMVLSGNGGAIPSGNGGMVIGNGGMIATGGVPVMGAGGMVNSAGGMVGIDLHCPPSPNPYLACEPGQYVRSCSNGVSDLLVSNTWDSAKVHDITSDSPFPLIFGGDQFGYHVQAGCIGGSVTFTLPP